MKNKRNVLIAFLLCACLIVGVGYAALSTELLLTGTASLSDTYMEELFDSKISWVSAESEDANKVTATISEDGDTITITADKLTTVNEEIEVLCKMKNESSDLTVNVTAYANGEAVTGEKVFESEYFYVKIAQTSDAELAPGESGTIVVYFKLLKSFVPTNDVDGDETVSISFDMTYDVTTAA